MKKRTLAPKKRTLILQYSDVKATLSIRTIEHIKKLKAIFAFEKVFGRADVIKVLGLKNTGSSSLLKKNA